MSSTDGREKSESDELSDKQFVDMVGDDIQPLSGKGSSHIAKPVQITPGVLERRKAAQEEVVAESNILDPASIIEQVDPLAYLEFVRPGVQHGVYKNLRLGKYEIQSRLDLHRHTVEQARNALWLFVDDCHKHGVRCALVTHGKGEGREQPARLKSCVNHWLRQFDQVLAFHSAQKTHGGVGATYILVKKDSAARRETGDKINQAKRMKR
ncbi:MAG: DNA endonuclease SmrA [Porticoccaceae bacterium]|jgi:DNA-nicking Smr family endonuclease|nr:DNA endonuclease SmrA [Porticoccaceae bacterium]